MFKLKKIIVIRKHRYITPILVGISSGIPDSTSIADIMFQYTLFSDPDYQLQSLSIFLKMYRVSFHKKTTDISYP